MARTSSKVQFMSTTDKLLYQTGMSALSDPTPYDEMERNHPDGVPRLKEPVLTIIESTPVLLGYDTVLQMIRSRSVLEPDHAVRQTQDVAFLQRRLPKLRPHDGRSTKRNYTVSRAKEHVLRHRALFIPDLDKIADLRDPRARRFPTALHLNKYPALKTMLANPDTQYQDLKAMRDGHVVLASVQLDRILNWGPEILDGIETGKRNSRMSIPARLNMVEWADAPSTTLRGGLEIHLLTQEDAAAKLGIVPPDGMIPISRRAAGALKVLDRTRKPVVLHDGDKLRGCALPFKGTIELRDDIPGHRVYLVEGGALKIKLRGQSRVITVTKGELLGSDPPFAVETRSNDRLMRSPRFSAHCLQALVGQIRALDPEIASQLVPQMDSQTLRLLSKRGTPIEYLDLCLFPLNDYPFNRKQALETCRQILSGERVMPITRGQVLITETEDVKPIDVLGNDLYVTYTPDGDIRYTDVQPPPQEIPVAGFGVTAAGRWLLHGVKPRVWKVWELLEPLVRKAAMQQLHLRVEGVGGIAQADAAIPIGVAQVSPRIWKRMKGQTEAVALYWPSKFPLFLHRITVQCNTRLTGCVVRVNPQVLEALGGDCDGDHFFLITDERVVPHVFKATDPVAFTDRISGTEIVYPTLIDAVLAERRTARTKITVATGIVEQSATPIACPHLRAAAANESVIQIGRGFIDRDVALDYLGFDDLASYTRFGEVCQEVLSGLKLSNPVDVVQWLLSTPAHLGWFLDVTPDRLHYVEQGPDQWGNPRPPVPIWRTPCHYADCYRTMTGRAPLDTMVTAAKAADPNATSLFEWMLARTRLSEVESTPLIEAKDLLTYANKLRATHRVTSRQERDARFLVTRTALEPLGTIVARDARYLRARRLMELQVQRTALEIVVCEHAATTGNVDVLGVLDALRHIDAPVVQAAG